MSYPSPRAKLLLPASYVVENEPVVTEHGLLAGDVLTRTKNANMLLGDESVY
jgi:hypothetical protein